MRPNASLVDLIMERLGMETCRALDDHTNHHTINHNVNHNTTNNDTTT